MCAEKFWAKIIQEMYDKALSIISIMFSSVLNFRISYTLLRKANAILKKFT